MTYDDLIDFGVRCVQVWINENPDDPEVIRLLELVWINENPDDPEVIPLLELRRELADGDDS